MASKGYPEWEPGRGEGAQWRARGAHTGSQDLGKDLDDERGVLTAGARIWGGVLGGPVRDPGGQ